MEDAFMYEAGASSLMFAPLLPGSQPRMRKRKVYTLEEWEAQKANIELLYVIERKTLKEVVKSFEDNFDFYATERQYKRRIGDWGFDKNFKNREMKAIVRKQQKRIAKGKKSLFEVKGRQVEQSRIDRAQKRYEHLDDFTNSQHSTPAPTPSDVICYTPLSMVPMEASKSDGSMIPDIHRIQAGIYWPPSPGPFQSPSFPFSPQDQYTTQSMPYTPGTEFLTSVLNSRTDHFTGESPSPFPSTPISSIDRHFDPGAPSTDTPIGYGDRSLDKMATQQDPFDFATFFSKDTGTDSILMGMDDNPLAEALNYPNSRSELAPTLRRRYKEEQERHYRQKLFELETVHGPEHPATLHMHGLLARTFRVQGRCGAAELSCRQIARTSQKIFGNNSERTLMAFCELSFILYLQGGYEIAEGLFRSLHRKALAIFGREHRVTLHISYHMSSLLQSRHKKMEATLISREVLGIDLRRNGPEALVTVYSMLRLASLLLDLSQVEEAERLLQNWIPLQENIIVDDEIRLIYNKTLGRLLSAQGRHKESEEMFRYLVKTGKALFGSEHPVTLEMVGALANSLRAQKRYIESKKLFLEVLAGRSKVLGPCHPSTEMTRDYIARLESAMAINGLYDDA